MKKIFLFCLLLIVQTINSFSQTFKVDTLLYNGPSDKYINLVIMGDGYTSAQQTQFISNAQTLSDYIWTQSPFSNYKNYFNVIAIRVISAESGVKHPRNAYDCPPLTTQPVTTANNYLGTTFDYFYHRLVTPTNTTNVYNVLSTNFPDYDQVFVIGNSTYYGGAGGQFATSTVNTQGYDVAVHEIGHSFAGLADEYWAGSTYAMEKPNMTQQSSPSLVKWKNWVGATFTSAYGSTATVGIYPHSTDPTWLKPSNTCKMQVIGTPPNEYTFCPVCKQTIIEKIHSLVNPVVNFTPATGTITSPNQFISFKLTKLMKPTPNTLKIHWRLNGSLIGRNVDSIKVNQNNLSNGNHTLTMSVEDTTSLLRVDNHTSVHSTTLTWTINKSPTNFPTLTTTTTSSITQNSANSGGNITSDGGFAVTSRGVCWSTSPNPTIALTTKTSNGTGIGTFTSSVTGLLGGTTYYIRAYATNSQGTSYGDEFSFTTLSLPILTTTAISTITTTTANSGGTVTSTGGAAITSQGVCWSTSPNPTNALTTKTSNGTTSPFTSNITGLSPTTTYYVRAYAVNSIGVGYGNELTFTTASIVVPTVSTTSVTSFTNNSGVMGGNVTSAGGGTVTRRGVCYATTTNPDTLKTTVNIGSGTGTFSQNITGLTLGTTYYVRAFAINSAGITYGTQVSFKTLGLPTVSTTAASNVTTTSIQTGGNVSSAGGGTLTVTARGVCWATTTTPTIANNTLSAGTGTGAFTSSITGLTQGVTYYIRAYATNSLGTSYGSQITQRTQDVPTVTTTAASAITTTSFTTGGNVTSTGGTGLTLTERGIVYSLTTGPTTSNTKIIDPATTTGAYTTNLSGLTPGTTYYVRAYAINSLGTGYGTERVVTTTNVPVLTTTAISGLSSSSATSGGSTITSPSSSVTAKGVCWSTSPNPTISLTTKTSNGTGTAAFTSSITGLSPSTLYYVRAYATNTTGTGYGNELTFTTTASGSVPTVTTTAVGTITQTSGVSGGSVTSDGGFTVTSRGICYATTQNPTTSNTVINSGTGTGTFTSNLTGLTPNTLYYIRAFATNSNGTSYGSQVSFTTLVSTSVPTVTTTTISSLTSTSVSTGGNVTSDGGTSVTERGVCYATTTSPTTSNTKLISGSGIGSYTVSITGLSSGMTYYLRAYAINSNGTSYGSEVTFTTLSLPLLTTNAITGISTTSASSGGNITSDGGASITQRGVCYATTQNPTISNSFTSDGTGIGSFSSNINGLLSNTLYYVRSYATNSVGTSYGNQLSFTTSSTPPPTNSCLVNDLSAYKLNNLWYYRWQINSNCTTYNVRLGRYDTYTNSTTPPPVGTVATTYGTRETGLNPSTCGCTVNGYVDKQMSSAPSLVGRWYSVNVTCNASVCSGAKETVAFFWVP